MKSSDINLLKAKTLLTPQMLAIEEQLRRASLIFLLFLLGTGIFFSVGYLILRRSHEGLVADKQAVMTAISAQTRKEGLSLSIKDRLTIAGKIIEQEKSWIAVLDLIERIVGSGKHTSFTVNDKEEVSLSINTASLEEAFVVVDHVLTESKTKALAHPILDTVQYQKDGSVRLSLTFVPIF